MPKRKPSNYFEHSKGGASGRVEKRSSAGVSECWQHYGAESQRSNFLPPLEFSAIVPVFRSRECSYQIGQRSYRLSSPSKARASLRSAVSKPSVNDP